MENNYGCREEHHGLIRIYNGPKAAIDKDIKYGRPEKVRFIIWSEDFSQCTWYLPGGLVVNSPDDQEVIFEREDVYPVSLAVWNEYGCRDSLHIDHRSYEGGLYFPIHSFLTVPMPGLAVLTESGWAERISFGDFRPIRK